MLYVTTRNNQDSFPPEKALAENRGPDGGMYLPFHPPALTPRELEELWRKSFAETVCEMLNRMFGKSLTAWDVEFAVGREPVRLRQLRNRIVVAEVWHTPRGECLGMERNLAALICPGATTDWARIGIRMAVLFGIFGELRRMEIREAEVAAVAGDLLGPMSIWYARNWGLPIRHLICTCNENKALWDLLNQGQMRTDGVCVSTPVPQADVAVPEQTERLIFECGGTEEVEQYLDACRKGRMYCPDDSVLAQMRQGMTARVVSSQRIFTTIPSVYRTYGQLLSPDGALAYGGVQDFRTSCGRTGWTLILEERSPALDADVVSSALNIPREELESLQSV